MSPLAGRGSLSGRMRPCPKRVLGKLPVARRRRGPGSPLPRRLARVIGGAALDDLSSARDRVVGTLDPAAFHASQLEVALLNQETGVRGYALSAQPSFLWPYNNGQAEQQKQVAM